MFALLALLALVFASASKSTTPQSTVWAGGSMAPPDDDGRDVDPLPPPPIPTAAELAISESDSTPPAPWSGGGMTMAFQGTVGSDRRFSASRLPKLPDGRYVLRVVAQTTTGTQLCWDVKLRFAVRSGLALTKPGAYIPIDPADVASCVYGTNIGPTGTYRIGDYRYAALNRTGFNGRGPAYALDLINAPAGIVLQVRSARDWRQSLKGTFTLQRTGDL